MKLYLSGKISGLSNYITVFADAEAELIAAGYEVLNPAPYKVEGWTWADYMEKDLHDLRSCEGIATLPNWKQSAGATIEVLFGKRLLLPVHTAKWWTNNAAIELRKEKEVTHA